MTSKTNEELQTENSQLTLKLNILNQNFDKLSKEHKIIQTKLQLEKEKTCDKCKKCDKNLDNVIDVKKIRNNKKSTSSVYKCDNCEKEFYEEWKLRAHMKTHKNVKCGKCEKNFWKPRH